MIFLVLDEGGVATFKNTRNRRSFAGWVKQIGLSGPEKLA
jgi:hypothetical protein